jgi:hypothetical protein
VYFDSIANPAQMPPPIHQRQPVARIARVRHSAMPSRAAINGPSGSTQVPVVTPNTGARLNAIAAHNPARPPPASFAIIQVERANNAMNGSRTITAASLPLRSAIPRDSHHDISG